MFFAAYIKQWKVTIIAVIISLLLTYALSNMAVIEKWDLRLESAVTENLLEEATTDGANKVFTLYIIAFLETVFFTWFWYWIGRKILKKYNQ
ncbi:MAG: hypothetical protein OQL19_02375 [Gammaproteobacteria bacterium]|nr:hypothetical protein [Gammaproteobacteria bacterium]